MKHVAQPTPQRAYTAAPGLTLLDRAIGYLSPGAGLRRYFDRLRLSRAYLAAAPGDTWRPKRPGASANADHQADANRLRAKSRFLIQNVDYIAAGMNSRVANGVGTGITVKWGGRHGPELAKRYATWSKVCDADGALNLHGIQSTAWRTMDGDGEVLIRIRRRRPEDNLPAPLQLQVLEVDWLDTLRQTGNDGNTVVNGKEFDYLGRCVAYWLWNQHPGDTGLLKARGLQSTRVLAKDIIHLYLPGRPGQSRGFPRLSPAINRIRDLQLLEDAEFARKNTESRLSVIASGDVSTMGNPAPGESTTDPNATGDLGQLAVGGITRVPGGLNLTVVEPTAAPGFTDYCKYNIHLACAGGGFTYESATGDMREVNFSSARVRQLDVRREIEQLQWLTFIPTLCERIADEFAQSCKLAGHITGPLDYTVEHSTPKWEYVNPGDDVKADLAEIAGGMSSISEKLRRRGYDPELVYTELASDINRLKGLGIWEDLGFLLKGVRNEPPPEGGATPPQGSA
jgi:lambda family phage portal protein